MISKILDRGSSLVERWRALRLALARLVATAREVPLNVSLDTVKRRVEPLLELVRKRAARIPLPSALRRNQPRTLQSHILALFLVLMVVVQVGGFALINTVGMAAARKSIGEDLVSGALVFDRLLDQDTHRLVQGAHLMSSDYTFREVIASGTCGTRGPGGPGGPSEMRTSRKAGPSRARNSPARPASTARLSTRPTQR